jgi:hypothetical protein
MQILLSSSQLILCFFYGTGREDSLTEYINKNKVSENKENYKTKRKKQRYENQESCSSHS